MIAIYSILYLNKRTLIMFKSNPIERFSFIIETKFIPDEAVVLILMDLVS